MRLRRLGAAEVLALVFVLTYVLMTITGLLVAAFMLKLRLTIMDVIRSFASPYSRLGDGPSVIYLINDYLGLHVVLRGYEVLSGYVWELVTSIFIHANAVHLITNAVALLITDSILSASTDVRGKDETVVFFSSGIVGNLATVALIPQVSSLGSSGAIFGLLAFAAVKEFRRSRSLTLVVLIVFVFVISSIPLVGHPNIVAHIAGLATGIAMGMRKHRRETRSYSVL